MSHLNDPESENRLIGARRAGFRSLVAMLALVVAWLAFKPAMGGEDGLPWDKANHALAFMVLTAVSLLGWPRAGFFRLGLIMLAAGVGIEVIQGLSFVGRDADGWDVVADMTGFVVGWAGMAGLRRLTRKNAFRG